MKNFEEKWAKAILQEKFKIIAESYWRAAYESIRNEILNNSRRASRSSIVGFIDEELDE